MNVDPAKAWERDGDGWILIKYEPSILGGAYFKQVP